MTDHNAWHGSMRSGEGNSRKAAAEGAIGMLFVELDATLEPTVFEEEYSPAVLEARKVLDTANQELADLDEGIALLTEHERALGENGHDATMNGSGRSVRGGVPCA